MPFVAVITDHPTPTVASGHRYQFTLKHHGCDPTAACWRPDLSLGDEFAAFDGADAGGVADGGGNLYGVLRAAEGRLADLGTWTQQVAEFPAQRPGEPWHGYPIYPVDELAPDHLQGDRCKPAKGVFVRMERARLVDRRERKRLSKGDYT